MSRGLFITGTDTGVGKTMVTAGIVRWLRKQGLDAIPIKPVQTGADKRGDRLVSPDMEFSLAASRLYPDMREKDLMIPYIYEPACSPHLAGRLAGRYPEIREINRCATELLMKHDVIVVEGAGGILVPLNEKETMLDLMKDLDFPVVLVARAGLGTINHTLLSIAALRSAGLKLTGVVFNRTGVPCEEARFIEDDNPATIENFGRVKVLGKLNFFENSNPESEAMWDRFRSYMPGLGLILDEVTK